MINHPSDAPNPEKGLSPVGIVGVIAEYNPFHNGHAYHLNMTRKLTGAGYCIAVMSGSFVQRGEPAIFDKYVRTRMALLNGADLVMEIPAAFSTASAGEFAAFGVRMLEALGAPDGICFGSESGNSALLDKAADLILHESPEFRKTLQTRLRSGDSYPLARAEAIAASLSPDASPELIRAFQSPNNILGIEYLRAIKETGNKIRPYTVQRKGNGYHDLTADGTMASASAIRRLLEETRCLKQSSDLLRLAALQVPENVSSLLLQEQSLTAEAFSLVLDCKILELIHRYGEKGLAEYQDISPELAARICNMEPGHMGFAQRIEALKTRQMTYTRISRALIHLLLEIKKEDMEKYKAAGYAPYARILGFKKDAAPLLSELKKKSQIPLITKLADAKDLLPESALWMLQQEIYAAHLYQTIKQGRFGGTFKNEYRQSPIII